MMTEKAKKFADPPHIQGWNPFKGFMGIRRDPLNMFLHARQFGDVVQLMRFPRKIYFINHPDHIKDMLVTHNSRFHKNLILQRTKRVLGNGLLTSEDEFHLRQRRLAQPAFHRQRIHGYANVMADLAARERDRWQNGTEMDIHVAMMKLTLAIAGKTLFDSDVENDSDDIGRAMHIFMEMFGLMFLPGSQYIEMLPLPAFKRLRKSRARVDEIIYGLISERRQSGRDHGDLLSMLIAASDAEGDGTGMSDQQLHDECLTILLAGHETTANALSWTWMLLARNPEVEAKFHSELENVLQGRRPTADDFSNLKYTEMVLAESMRLYPPAWAMGREAMEDHFVADYRIPRGAMVLCSQWAMHRDERYWSNPLKFDPERFLPEAKAMRPKFSYFPFGGGPRLCIGESFAWMEGVLVLATIAQQWKFKLVESHPIELQPVITLRPKHGIRVIAEKR